VTLAIDPDIPRLKELPPIRQWSLTLIKRPVAGAMRLLWDVQVHGQEHVPDHGGVILAANHIGILDGPLVVAMSRRLCFALAKHDLFTGVLGAIFTHVGQIAINRRQVDKWAISRSLQVLDSGKVLAVFPEGARGAGEMTYAKGGAVYFALVTGAPIVPVAILGTREAGQSTIQLPQTGWPRRREDVTAFTEQVRRTLAEHISAAQAVTGVPLPGPPKPKGLHRRR